MIDLIVDVSEPVALVGGAELAPQHLNILQKLTETFVAADGGADHLHAAGLKPQAIIGDLDSISDAARADFAPQLVHVAEQDTTDLEKVVSRVGAPVLVGAGFLGGRIDHSFASFSVLARFPDVPLILLSESECCFRCPDHGLDLTVPVGIPLAVLPMDALRCTSRGLVWDMNHLTLHPAHRVSSSNMSNAAQVRIDVTGAAIITLPVAQLEAAIAAVRVG